MELLAFGSAPGAGSPHVLATTTALGPKHTVSGLTAGMVLRAVTATTARFEHIQGDDLAGSPATNKVLAYDSGVTNKLKWATAGTGDVLSTGIGGGQTIEGDTASGGALTLSSTHHATKGLVNIQSNVHVNDSGDVGSGAPAGTDFGVGAVRGIYVRRDDDGSGHAPKVVVHGFAIDTPAVNFVRANGTLASPLHLLSSNGNNEMGAVSFYGLDTDGGSTYSQGGAFTCVASEDWSSGAHGSRMNWRNVPNGTTTPLLQMRLHPGGTLSVVKVRIGDTTGSPAQISGNTEASQALDVLGNATMTGTLTASGASHNFGTADIDTAVTIGQGGVAGTNGSASLFLSASANKFPQFYLYRNSTKEAGFAYDGTNVNLQHAGRLKIQDVAGTPATFASFSALGELRLGDGTVAGEMLDVQGATTLYSGQAAALAAGVLKYLPTFSIADATQITVNLAPTITWTDLDDGAGHLANFDYVRCAGTHTITGSDNPKPNFMRSFIAEYTVQSSLNGISPWMPDILWHGCVYKLIGNGSAGAIAATNETTPYLIGDYGTYSATEGASLTLSDNTTGSPTHTGQLYNGIFSVFSKPVFAATASTAVVSSLTIPRRFHSRWAPPTFTVSNGGTIHLKEDGFCLIEDYDSLASGVTVDDVRIFESLLDKTGSGRPTHIFNIYFSGTAPSTHRGDVRIGDNTLPTSTLDVAPTIAYSGTAENVQAIGVPLTITNTDTTLGYSVFNPTGTITYNAAQAGSSVYLYDNQVNLVLAAAGTVPTLFTTVSRPTITASANMTAGTQIIGGFQHFPNYTRTSSFTIVANDDAVQANMLVSAGATLTTRRGLNFTDAIGAGAVTTQVVVDVPALTKGSINVGLRSHMDVNGAFNWNLYCDGTAPSSMVGGLRLGDNAQPAQKLEVNGKGIIVTSLRVGDTTAASTASLEVAASSGGTGIYLLANAPSLTASTNVTNMPGLNLGASGSFRLLSITNTYTQTGAPPAASSATNAAVQLSCTFQDNAANDGAGKITSMRVVWHRAAYKQVSASADQLVEEITGLYSNPTIDHTGSNKTTVTLLQDVYSQPKLGTTEIVTTRYGLNFQDQTTASRGQQSTCVAVNVSALTNGTNGTPSNFTFCAALATAITSGTNRWGIYDSGGANHALTGNLRLGDTSAPTAPISMLGVAGNPGSVAAGDLWYNTTQKSWRVKSTVGVQGVVGVVAANTSSSSNITNTTTETAFSTGSFAFPASSMVAGKTVRITAGGTFSTASSGNHTLLFTFRWGTTTSGVLMFSTQALATPANQSGKGWTCVASITWRSTTTVCATGFATFHTNQTSAGGTQLGILAQNTVLGATTIDANATTMTMFAQWGSGVTSADIVALEHFVVEVLD